jgi:hypothetical protein
MKNKVYFKTITSKERIARLLQAVVFVQGVEKVGGMMVDDCMHIEYETIDDDEDGNECKAVIYVDDPGKNICAESRAGGWARMSLAEKVGNPSAYRNGLSVCCYYTFASFR